MTDIIEIQNFEGKGYQPLFAYGSWRVAVLRHLEELDPDRLHEMERHNETDEVFVLVTGVGMLILGGNGSEPGNIGAHVMKIGEVCNVKKNTWHTVTLSQDAHVLIVENEDTGRSNSEYCALSLEDKRTAQSFAGSLFTK